MEASKPERWGASLCVEESSRPKGVGMVEGSRSVSTK